ncbi:flagellar hook-associated protein FlgL [Thorsellia anophelis]|uniref:Flagellar hook-associated protein 3 FlgL n=1 Tax=Thorsellia anophelis DSM 18579 TaxID=1123402 RepID=A0A1H9ZF11_9GAMM|nr:flagellar hook-associated protein FlgL [Thorsellia anophelis]SES80178.1 flagellar hook-associated protein 3 FlgL [Thorsellia anophelis DSM 18579]
MISTSMMYQMQSNSIGSANEKWLTSGLKLSTMKRVVNPSDDALAASQAVRIKQSLGLGEQYQTARNFANSNIALSENVIQNVNGVLAEIKVTIVNAGNTTISDEDRLTLSSQLEGLKEELLGLANTRDGLGNFIFSGFKTDIPPFVKDDVTGVVTYQGGDTAMTQKVNPTRELAVSYLGSDIFEGLPANPVLEPDDTPSGMGGVFDTLDKAIAALKVPLDSGTQADRDAFTAAMDSANRGIQNASSNASRVQTDMGLSMRELTNLDDLGAQENLNGQERLSDMVDLDPVKGISEYMLNLNSLQASYQTFMDMKGLSLFNLAR